MTTTATAPQSAPSTPATGLRGRAIVGYQGWFGCPGDFEGNTQWIHWFVGPPSARTLTVDLLPDVQQYPPEGLCDTGLLRADGTPLKLFSSQSPSVVAHHFRLMASHGVGGVALERFVVSLQDPVQTRRADHVLQLVLAQAQASGVPFFISYDVTGADPATAIATIRVDWQRLNQTYALSNAPAYLQDAGKPVLQLWGFGFVGNPGRPAEVLALLSDLKAGANGLPAATLIGGVPTNWRTLDGDADPDPAWPAVYRSFDVLSPWSVGRVSTEAQVQDFYASRVAADLAALAPLGLRYLPVLFPGFSRANLMATLGRPELAIPNQIPRNCGRLLWSQAQQALARKLDAVYVAMLDEFDEGTAMLPLAATPAALPVGAVGVAADQDGCRLPPDGYLGLLATLAASLRTGAALPALPAPN